MRIASRLFQGRRPVLGIPCGPHRCALCGRAIESVSALTVYAPANDLRIFGYSIGTECCWQRVRQNNNALAEVERKIDAYLARELLFVRGGTA
jgi:hypothetical protein